MNDFVRFFTEGNNYKTKLFFTERLIFAYTFFENNCFLKTLTVFFEKKFKDRIFLYELFY